MNDALCQACQDIFTGDADWEKDASGYRYVLKRNRPHHASTRELRECSVKECMLCAAIWHSLPEVTWKNWSAEDDKNTQTKIFELDGQIYSSSRLLCTSHYTRLSDRTRINITVGRIGQILQHHNLSPSDKDSVVLRACDRNDKIEVSQLKPRQVHESIYTPESLKFIKDWLQECDTLHEVCAWERRSGWLPSRLIYLPDSNDPPKLIETSSLSEPVRYTTLSHCWGSRPTLRLLLENYQDFKIGITGIPQTYKDAIAFTKDLGIKYVWIDSLCIIQNSKLDWNKECTEIANVYKNGYCNIVAMMSRDSHSGCFSKADPSLLQPFIVRTTWTDTKERYWRWEFQHTIDLLQREVGKAPAHKRSWVLQERLLSPRNVHFGEHAIYCECRKIISRPFASTSHEKHEEEYSLFVDKHKPAGVDDAVLKWGSLVNRYTRTALTLPDDKLVAISALAKQFQANMSHDAERQCEYLAGLWLPKLHEQLLWRTQDPSATTRIESDVPSWSWARLDGAIIYGHITGRDSEIRLSTVKSSQVLGPDPFSRITGGTLHVDGRLWKIKHPITTEIREITSASDSRTILDLVRWQYSDTSDYDNLIRDRVKLYFRYDIQPSSPNKSGIYLFPCRARLGWRYRRPEAGNKPSSESSPRMSTRDDKTVGELDPPTIRSNQASEKCLISGMLLQSIHKGSPHFERVGLFWIAAAESNASVRNGSAAGWTNHVGQQLRARGIIEVDSDERILSKVSFEIH